MSKFLYPIYKLKTKSYIKWWLYHKKAGGSGILSEILEGFSFNLENTLNRKFKLFEIEGNSVQDGSPSPDNEVPILSSGDNGSINEKISNKNILNLSNLSNGSLSVDYGTISSSNTRCVSEYMWIKAGTYIINNAINNWIKACKYDKNKKFLGSIFNSNRSENIFTLNEDCYVVIGFDEPLLVVQNSKTQLEPGTTATPYVPHKEQDYSIFVQQPFRSNKDKTIKDKFVVKSDNKKYERHYIGEVVLNGTEEVYLYNDNGRRAVFYINVADLYDYTNSTETPELLSNRFRPVSQTATWEPGGIACRIGGRAIFFIFKTGTSLNEFKNWLSTHNVVVQYLLAEPQDLPCTETQIQQLENLPSTYKDFTIIQSQDETPAHLKIQYWKEVQP